MERRPTRHVLWARFVSESHRRSATSGYLMSQPRLDQTTTLLSSTTAILPSRFSLVPSRAVGLQSLLRIPASGNSRLASDAEPPLQLQRATRARPRPQSQHSERSRPSHVEDVAAATFSFSSRCSMSHEPCPSAGQALQTELIPTSSCISTSLTLLPPTIPRQVLLFARSETAQRNIVISARGFRFAT